MEGTPVLARSAAFLPVVALTVLLLAARAEGAPPSANTARQPGLFAFEALTGGIFTIRADGTGSREIVPGGSDPEWSPDGSRLLYGLDGSLWSARSDGTDARLIIGNNRRGTADGPCNTEFAVSDGTWSPSGRRVAFVGQSEDEKERSVQEICTAALDGSEERMLRNGTEPNWIPGGRRIAFIAAAKSRQSFSSRIATMRSDGRDLRVLLGDKKGYRHSLDVSPDGRRLAFLETSSAPGPHPTVLRIMNLRTRRTTTIPSFKIGLTVQAAVWTPGGSRLAYVLTGLAPGQRVPPSSVFTIRPDGTGRKQLFTLPYEEHRGLWGEALSWQPPH